MSIKNIIGSILAVAAFGSFALAQGGQPNQPSRDGRGSAPGAERGDFGRRSGDRGLRMMAPRMMDFNRLNLTDAQKQRVQALQENQRRMWETNQAQFEEMGRLMRLKREGLLTTEQGTRLTSLQAQMKTNMDRMQADLLAILTPEQRILADQMRNERGGRMRGMRDGGRIRLDRRGPGRPNRPGAPGRVGMPPPPPAPANN